MAIVVNDRTGERFPFKGILLLSLSGRYDNMATISLHRGQDIRSTVSDICNSYIRISLLPDENTGSLYRTEAVFGTSDPVFDETVSIEVAPEEVDRRIYISLWCKNVLHKNHCEFIGCMSFNLSQIFQHEMGGWYYLLPHNIGSKGYVKVTKYLFGIPSFLHQEIHEVMLKRGDGGVSFALARTTPATVCQANERANMAGLQDGDFVLRIMNDDVSKLSADFISRYLKACGDTDLRLEVARNILVSFPEPSQNDHYSIHLVNEDKELGEQVENTFCNQPHLSKKPGDSCRRSLRVKISGALGKIGRQMGKSIRSKSRESVFFSDGEKNGWSPYRRKIATPSTGNTVTPRKRDVESEVLHLRIGRDATRSSLSNSTARELDKENLSHIYGPTNDSLRSRNSLYCKSMNVDDINTFSASGDQCNCLDCQNNLASFYEHRFDAKYCKNWDTEQGNISSAQKPSFQRRDYRIRTITAQSDIRSSYAS